MEHKMIEKAEFKIIGIHVKVSLNYPDYKKKIKNCWNGLMPRVKEIKNRVGEEFYGTCKFFEGNNSESKCETNIPEDCSFETLLQVFKLVLMKTYPQV